MRSLCRLLVCLALAVATGVSAQPSAARRQTPGAYARGAEARTARAYEEALKTGPAALRMFLVEFPKGADLHMHLSGSVYAETFIRDAGEDGLCVNPAALSFAQPLCSGKLIPAQDLSGNITAANQTLYDRLIDSFSMRGFVPSAAWSGHDQFFATFDRFGGLSKRHEGEWVDEVAGLAAAENEQYIELMETPPFAHAARIAGEIGWSAELERAGLERADPRAFARLRQELLDRGLRDEVAADLDEVRDAETGRLRLERCGTPQATPACSVQVRYIYQVLRGYPPQQVFAQALLGFETVQASMRANDDLWAGINFVMPEDGYISMRDYTLQMKMLDYLHSVYPRVHITLHAGELTLGLVPPAGLRFHIRQAVELGHAERIGHGVDIMYEDNARQLLKELADRHIMIEINLTSNAVILGVKGADHPFPIYRAAHMPVALSTDDEGVSRIDLTHEFVLAATEYHLSYADLKQLARTGMEHDFLPGASLWAREDDFSTPVAACRGQALGGDRPTAACKEFLDGSQKAAEQWELERRFRVFEAQF
jgi:adenosine deaminase